MSMEPLSKTAQCKYSCTCENCVQKEVLLFKGITLVNRATALRALGDTKGAQRLLSEAFSTQRQYTEL
jgi:hypothetical protein